MTPVDPVYYTVTATNGDYAEMKSDQGVENTVALFLLPEGVGVGTRLKRELLEWSVVEEGQA